MPSKPQPDRFLSYAEVAEMIGLAVKTVRNGDAGTKEIPRIKLGGRVLFSLLAVQRWMEKKSREAEEVKQRANNIIDLMASKIERQKAVANTLTTIINRNRNGRRHSR